MKFTIFFSFLIFISACSTQTVESQKTTENSQTEIANQAKQMVLVELFTSEG